MRKLVCPYPIDQLICADRTIHVNQQSDEKAPLAGVPDIQALPVYPGLDIAEQPEFHCHLYSLHQAIGVCPINRYGRILSFVGS